MPSSRAVTPVIGVVLAAALVVIVSSSIAAVTLDMGSQIGDSPPAVAFESEVDETVILRHAGGDSIEGSRVEIRGGTPQRVPETIRSGDAIEVTPDGNSSEVTVVWATEDTSTRLTTVDTTTIERNESESETPDRGDYESCVRVSSDTTEIESGLCVIVESGVSVDAIENVWVVFAEPDAEIGTVDGSYWVVLEADSEVTGDVTATGYVSAHDETQVEGNVTDGRLIEDDSL
ncbi:type IV pilin [Halohasta litorea]|nr:type IV pilin N-terminal domain-containing protein [Halohasta litorea]MEA1932421.1 type IV pilin N-terminal domain-containing protein [Euryarchaeota archaeon]